MSWLQNKNDDPSSRWGRKVHILWLQTWLLKVTWSAKSYQLSGVKIRWRTALASGGRTRMIRSNWRPIRQDEADQLGTSWLPYVITLWSCELAEQAWQWSRARGNLTIQKHCVWLFGFILRYFLLDIAFVLFPCCSKSCNYFVQRQSFGIKVKQILSPESKLQNPSNPFQTLDTTV